MRRSDDLKSTLLSLVSHELQTPLTVIKTAATSLHQDHDLRSGAAFETLTTVVVDEEPPPVQLDYLLFDRVMANLILNAIRYAPSEAPIEIRVGYQDDQILLRFIDHGPGVPTQELTRIFDRFYRREGPWAGNGLGLALSKRIVEAHGGKIWTESRVIDGPGLVIAVTLPVPLPPGAGRLLEGLDIRAAS